MANSVVDPTRILRPTSMDALFRATEQHERGAISHVQFASLLGRYAAWDASWAMELREREKKREREREEG